MTTKSAVADIHWNNGGICIRISYLFAGDIRYFMDSADCSCIRSLSGLSIARYALMLTCFQSNHLYGGHLYISIPANINKQFTISAGNNQNSITSVWISLNPKPVTQPFTFFINLASQNVLFTCGKCL